MNGQKKILVTLVAISTLFFLGYRGFGLDKTFQTEKLFNISNSLNTPDPIENKAWATFQNYLAFAKVHNLQGLRDTSYQISSTCKDASKEKECFALMDSVYNIASPFKITDFTHVLVDARQIIMYTDAPTVVILYFTREIDGTPKVLGMRFCFEDETSTNKCVQPDQIKVDANANGWWDSVESLFYR